MSARSAINKQLRKFEKRFETYNEITISRSALLHNFDFFQACVPGGSVLPVLKSNAYGHGIAEVATILKARNFPYIAVDGFYESTVIHGVSKQPVLVMGAIKPINFRRMSFKRIAVVVQDVATIRALGALRRRVKVHIEIETGMHRHGVPAADLPEFLSILSQYPKLEVEGVMTHLADADNPIDNTYNLAQTDQFDAAVAQVVQAGFSPKYFHIAQSAGSTKINSKYANALRIGVALYGINPLEPSDERSEKLHTLQPALALTSTITKVHVLAAGDTVSYGRTFTAKQSTRVGVLPFGYYEGLPRALSNRGQVEYKGTYLAVAGRICMNHTMIDLGNSAAKVGDTVTIISTDPRNQVSVKNICQTHDLFSYSLLVGLNQNIRRRIV